MTLCCKRVLWLVPVLVPLFTASGLGAEAQEMIEHGWGLYESGDYEGAISVFTDVIERYPADPAAYTFRGACYEMLGDPRTALDDYLVVFEIDPEIAENLYNMGRMYEDLGEYDRAVELLTQAIYLDPFDPCYVNTRGCVFNYMSDYDAAVEDISLALEMDPEYATAWANLGCAERGLGNDEYAITCFTNAMSFQDQNQLIASYLMDRGVCYAHLEDYDSAIADHIVALDLCPGTASKYAYTGWLLLTADRYAEAIPYYDIAIGMDPGNADWFLNRGFCHYQLYENGKAISDLNECRRIDPLGFDDYQRLGRAYGDVGDYTSAIEVLTTGLEGEQDTYSRAWMLSDRARCRRLTEDLDGCISDYAAASDLLPEEPYFYFALGEAYYLADRDDEAVERFDTAVEWDLDEPWLAGCLFERGHCYLLRGDFDQAIGDFTGALASDPDYHDAYYLRGVAHYYAGDFDRCREDLEEFLTVGTDPQYRAEARAVLSELE
jgi:tetratricopeptide (TPR) repeat protein